MAKRRPWLTQLYKIKRTEHGEQIDQGLDTIRSYIQDSADNGDLETIELFLEEVDLTRLNTAFVVGICMHAWDVDVNMRKYREFARRVRAELNSRPEMKGHVEALLKSFS